MKDILKLGLYLTAAAGGVILGMWQAKKQHPTITPPAVVIHDTVTLTQFKEDTIRLTKQIEKLKIDTVWLAQQTVSVPETLKVVPELYGMTLFKAGRFLGDTTTAAGFHVIPDSMMTGDYVVNGWIHKEVAPGPVDGFVLYGNGTLKMGYSSGGFPQACTFWDDRRQNVYGALGFALLERILGR